MLRSPRAAGGVNEVRSVRSEKAVLAKPFPVELKDAVLEPGEDHRNLFCAHSDDCLNLAVERGWEGWTCARCPLLTRTGNKPGIGEFANRRRGD